MMQYLYFFKLRFITNLQYRAAALAGISTQFFFGFIFVMVYVAFYKSSSSAKPINMEELVTYIWLGQAFYSLTYVYYRDKDFLGMIKNGDIAYELARPQNLYLKWYIKILAGKVSSALLKFLPILIVAFILPKPYNLSLPHSYISFILFLISLIFATILVTAIVTLFNTFVFFTMDEKGTIAILGVIAELFSGQIVPVPLMPKSLIFISSILPFRFIFDIPYRIYSGNININNSIISLFIQLIWIIVMISIGVIVQNKILKKVVVQGG